jgi:hypothetical protein
MPDNFYCGSCKLGFALGWFHYHGEDDGYGSETLLVCSACGTMHSIQHPNIPRIPVLGGLFSRLGTPEKPDRLRAQSGPCFVENAKDDVMQRLKAWEECNVTHVLRPKSKHSYMKDYLELGPVQCHHCGRTATIVRDWDYYNVRCPACGQAQVSVVSQWMT